MLWLLRHGGLQPAFAKESRFDYSGDVATPMSCALATAGCGPVVEYLLEHGVGVDSLCDGHCTPLTLAAHRDSIEYAELLLARGAVAWGPTNNVLTAANLLKARQMCEAFDETAQACVA